MSSLVEILRLSGAGNSFWFLDARAGLPQELTHASARMDLAKRLCGNFSDFEQTDGFILLEKNDEVDFSWDFYNSDGSGADMCGNAARCVSLLLHETDQRDQLEFSTGAGNIETLWSNQEIRVHMPPIKFINDRVIEGIPGTHVAAGVPHFVVERSPDAQLAKQLRQAKALIPEGANVTFLERRGPKTAMAVTFERGVENFTTACGTGAVAVAAVLNRSSALDRVEVRMPGGTLFVESAALSQRPWLIGEAKLEKRLHIDLKTLGL